MAIAEPTGQAVAFVSHATDHDGTVATAICAGLESKGLRCWISSRDIPPGVSWPQAIVEGINTSHLLVLVLSTAANRSKWVLREVMAADKRGLPIVPVRIEDVEPDDTLDFIVGPAQWLDAFPPPVDEHLDEIVRLVDSLARSP
jgi:TIR domain